MPLRVTDPTQWCPSTPGLRWARNNSVDLIGSSGWRPSLVVGRRGRERNSSAIAPGSFSGLAAASGHNLGTKKIWSLRPRGTSAKNWSPGLIGAAVITFEWIAQGFTAKSFWTAPWPREAKQRKAHRATLRSLLRGSRSWKAGRGLCLALPGPIESE
jgi:hypothetical protein